MKVYYGCSELRLTGKAWEIRAKLKEMMRKAEPALPLYQHLKGVVPRDRRQA